MLHGISLNVNTHKCKIHSMCGSLTHMSPELTSLPMFVFFQYSLPKVYTTLCNTTLLKEHSID